MRVNVINIKGIPIDKPEQYPPIAGYIQRPNIIHILIWVRPQRFVKHKVLWYFLQVVYDIQNHADFCDV